MSDLNQILDLINFDKYKTIWVGYSGGVDSSVLLKLISLHPTLKHKITAIYINHNIQTQSFKWQKHCQLFCNQLNIKFIAKVIEPRTLAKTDNLEQRARQARYDIFEKLIQADDCLLLGHHLQDQAETVLLRLFRGAGIDGLTAMKVVSKRKHLNILRPFLKISKALIINYANNHHLKWIEDLSNQDSNFDRNFIRNELMPLIKTRYPGIDNNLSRTASICLEHQTYLSHQINEKLINCKLQNNNLSINKLLELTRHEQALVVRAWLKKANIKMPTKQQLELYLNSLVTASNDKQPLLNWGENNIQSYKKELHYYKNFTNGLNQPQKWFAPYKDIRLKNINKYASLKSSASQANIHIDKDDKIELRFRQGGETIKLNGMTKKVKKLLQTLEIPPWHREHVPLLYINNKVAAIGDYIIANQFNIKNNFRFQIL